MKRAYFFGCLSTPGRKRPGHYLYSEEYTYCLEPEIHSLPWKLNHLDSGLLENAKERDNPTGRVISTYSERDGVPWWAFVWWDRSGDQRGASNSGFYVRGFTFAEQCEAFAFACSQWPQVVARQQYTLILVDYLKVENP